MSLTGQPLLVLVAVVLALSVLALVLLADRLPGGRLLRALQRLLLVLLAQAGAVFLVFLLANSQLVLFSTWSDLLGQQNGATASPLVDPAQQHRQRAAAAAALAGQISTASVADTSRARNGVLVSTRVRGAQSGLDDRISIFLPPQYFQPAFARTRFPVLELLDGHPGTPATWIRTLRIPDVLRAGTAARSSLPFVLLMPDINIEGRYDTDCQNVMSGPAVDTLLGVDIPAVATLAFRVRSDRLGWATMGYSEGAYCAVIEAQRHPRTFAAAVGMSGGYGTSSLAAGPFAIYGSHQALLAASPLWRVHKLPPVPPLQYLITASRQETDGTYQESALFAAAVRPPSTADTLFLAAGGHNPATWGAVLPHALSWLSTRPSMADGMPPDVVVNLIGTTAWSPARTITDLPPITHHRRRVGGAPPTRHSPRPTRQATGPPAPAGQAPATAAPTAG